MCDRTIEKFKSNSQVIPRCLFSPVKIDGKMVAIDNTLKENKFSSKELVGDFICVECEQKTRKDDAFAKEFFIDRKYLENKFDLNKFPIKYIEKFNLNCFINFKLFITSIILRHYCYQKIINGKELIPNLHLVEIRNIYQIKDTKQITNKYPLLIWKQADLEREIYYQNHRRHDGKNALDMFLLGYRIHMLIDKRHSVCDKSRIFCISDHSFVCFAIHRITKLHNDLWKNITNNDTIGKLKNIIDTSK